MHKMVRGALLLGLLSGWNCKNRGSGSVDTSALKPGMSMEEVRKQIGEPLPGPVNNDQIRGVQTAQFIYPSGDDAIFVVAENGVVKKVTKERVTMKDAAALIKSGMSEVQVHQILGEPGGSGLPLNGRKAETYENPHAALDTLTVTYENGRISKIEVIPNSAISAYNH